LRHCRGLGFICHFEGDELLKKGRAGGRKEMMFYLFLIAFIGYIFSGGLAEAAYLHVVASEPVPQGGTITIDDSGGFYGHELVQVSALFSENGISWSTDNEIVQTHNTFTI